MTQLLALFRRLSGRATVLELASAELDAAEREKLQAESAREYATAMVLYHEARIQRLRNRLGHDNASSQIDA
jgi:hypothetical protein